MRGMATVPRLSIPDGLSGSLGVAYMDVRTMTLLALVGVIIGYAAYRNPVLGSAIAVATAVVAVTYTIFRDDDGSGK